MSDDLIAQAWALLCAHDLVPAGMRLDDLRADLTDLDPRSEFCNVVGEALQERALFFDTECISGEEDYAELVRLFAAATHGEWQPADLRSTFLYPERASWDNRDSIIPLDIVIEFTSWGRTFVFRFSHYLTDWVADDLWGHIDTFAEGHLTGRYVQIPTDDQCYLGVYVPAPAASKLEDLIERLDDEHPPRPASESAFGKCRSSHCLASRRRITDSG